MPKNWKTYKLSELGLLARGKSKHRPRDDAFLYGGKYPFIQTGDIKAANHKINKHTQTYSEEGLKQSKLWPEGTICITIAA
ncbi:MAG: restriction endonuclease subunit S, partial [Flammeovirgaceae bacterium]